jgi:hypothetical protein
MQREGCHLQLDHQTVHISLNEKITLGYYGAVGKSFKFSSYKRNHAT